MTIATLKDLKPITPGDKILKTVLDRASTQTIEKNIDPNICDACDSMTHYKLEIRENGYMEFIRYCYVCGKPQT